MKTNLHWVCQANLGTDKIHLQIKEACDHLGLKCTFVDRVPFSKDLPDVPTNNPTIFYGSTRFVDLVFSSKKWSPAAFFDPKTFLTSIWGPAYGTYWINSESKITTLRKFAWEAHPPDRLYFVRPVRDMKEFTGGVWSYDQITRWNSGLIKTDLGEEQLLDIPIIVGEPWKINTEWRLFIVNGKVSSASQYKKDGRLNVDSNVSKEVLEFGEDMCQIFSPHNIFVLDICESAGNLFVLEIGCVNSAGFYAADLKKIITDISETI